MEPITSSYIHLTEGCRPVEDGHDRIYYCELNRYYSENVFRNFSIKFTLEGAVEYRTGKERYVLRPNTFLLSSRQPCECVVDSRAITRNISIDISDSTMHETFTVLSPGTAIDLDHLEAGHFTSPDFFEHLYPAGNSALGQYLLLLGNRFTTGQSIMEILTDEIFFSLAEKVILHEKGIQYSLLQLNAIKPATKKETMKRLLAGREFMDQHFLSNISIPEIAQQAHLSQYYFLRSFKNAFQLSPYQYMMDKRLRYADQLLQNKKSIQDVADHCGFPDASSFSKAYKKKFGVAPSFRPGRKSTN